VNWQQTTQKNFVRVVLDTEQVKINEMVSEYQVLIKIRTGGVLEHEPFPKDLQGLVSAMQLATECLAGKFFPRSVLGADLAKLGVEIKTIGHKK
jgi:hypothetical protein